MSAKTVIAAALLAWGAGAAYASGATDLLQAWQLAQEYRLSLPFAAGGNTDAFARMVAALGGPADFCERPLQYLPQAPVQRPAPAPRAGWARSSPRCRAMSPNWRRSWALRCSSAPAEACCPLPRRWRSPRPRGRWRPARWRCRRRPSFSALGAVRTAAGAFRSARCAKMLRVCGRDVCASFWEGAEDVPARLGRCRSRAAANTRALPAGR